MLGLCTAGPARPAFAFEAAALVEHVGFQVALAAAACGAEQRVRAEIADLDQPGAATRLEALVCEPLRDLHPAARIEIDPARTRGATYYAGAAFRIVVETEGGEVEFTDGGVVDWLQRLLADRRERMVVSGLGVEQLAGLLGG
jgi:histidyl-tRNA synthetase